jgi:hypothetical protein
MVLANPASVLTKKALHHAAARVFLGNADPDHWETPYPPRNGIGLKDDTLWNVPTMVKSY